MAKAIFLLVLFGITLNRALSLDVCDGQKNNALLIHPADCSKYIVCENGQTFKINQCTNGEHFNRLTLNCDTPIEAACDVSLIKKSWTESGDCGVCRSICGCYSQPECPSPNTPSPVTPDSPSPVTPAPGIPSPNTPSPGTPTPEIPSPNTPTPGIPSPATPSPLTPTPVTPSPVDPSPETPGPATPSPNTPSPEKPSPGTPSPETPIPGTIPPDTPRPGTPATPAPENPSPNTPGPNPDTKCENNLKICGGKPDNTHLLVPGSCQEFAVCILGCATVLTCPNNLLYNIDTRICDKPTNVNCPYPIVPPSGPLTGPSGTKCEQPGKCAGQQDGTLFSDNNSNGYIVCQCECEIARPCPGGLVFNDELNVCDYPSETE